MSTNISIPAGLTDSNVEIFSIGNDVRATHNGVVKQFFDLPLSFLSQLEDDLMEKPSAVSALQAAGYTTKSAMIKKYAECRFGGFNKYPDVLNGNLTGYEYWECGNRGSCPFEGIVCGFIKSEGKIYTPFEIQLIKRLSSEDTLPVIAEKLKVSINTLDKRKKELFEKMGVLSRARLVAKAYELEIL